MNASDQNKLKQQLLNLQIELNDLEAFSKESGKTVELDQSTVGRLSRMDALQLQQMALESERRRKVQLAKIEGALGRIHTDEYGYCVDCDTEIDIRRLFFDPTNVRCIKCAEK